MSQVFVFQTLSSAQQAKAKTPFGLWVGGATSMIHHPKKEPWLDIAGCADLNKLMVIQGATHIGAAVPLTILAHHAEVKKTFPLLHEAVNQIATPQTRHRATVGGALCQESRCPYLRHEDYHCLKVGGKSCFARGDEGFPFAIIDNRPCAALHASTLGLALLVLDARMHVQVFKGDNVETHMWPMEQFFDFDVNQVEQDNALPKGALVKTIHLEEGKQGNRQKYFRLASRRLAEWAEVEVAVNAQVSGRTIQWLKVGVGAVARRPLRLRALEKAATGRTVDEVWTLDFVRQALPQFSPLKNQEGRVEVLARTITATFHEVFA